MFGQYLFNNPLNMKKLLSTLFMLLMYNYCFCQSKPKLTDEVKLNQCIQQQTNYFTFNGATPNGKGWDILTLLFKQNQFVAWGEYHNSPVLSRLTAYALESAAKQGYKAFCVETSPFVATELMRIANTKSPADTLLKLYKSGYPNIGTLPFFKSKEDAEMLVAVKKFKYAIWGIDQEFQMSFSHCMAKVFGVLSKKRKKEYQTVYDSLQAKWWYPDTKLLDSLNKITSKKNLKAVLKDIKISKEIYRNNDNEGRAALMKRNFFDYYNSCKNEKVFLKLGNNHLAKGLNLQTNIYDIGNAVYELAQRNGTSFANVYLMVRFTTENGTVVDDFANPANENPKVFNQLYDKERWVLVDIRKMRTSLRYDGSLTKDTYALLEKYDYVLISPEVMN